ncbi:MAG: hypothetical protein ACFB2W_14705 [Leptolyngbyaceae cyanobacterium]
MTLLGCPAGNGRLQSLGSAWPNLCIRLGLSEAIRHPSFRSMSRYALGTHLNRAERGNPNAVWLAQ